VLEEAEVLDDVVCSRVVVGLVDVAGDSVVVPLVDEGRVGELDCVVDVLT
jgi:hypothetical protein